MLIDFYIKYIVRINIKDKNGYKFLNGLINIVYIENRGAAFGIFSDNTLFLIALNMGAIIFLISIIFNMVKYNRVVLCFLSLIIGGGLGNLLDRLMYGYVIDYIKLSFFSPVCNLADYCITAGSIGLIFYVVFVCNGASSKIIKEK